MRNGNLRRFVDDHEIKYFPLQRYEFGIVTQAGDDAGECTLDVGELVDRKAFLFTDYLSQRESVVPLVVVEFYESLVDVFGERLCVEAFDLGLRSDVIDFWHGCKTGLDGLFS